MAIPATDIKLANDIYGEANGGYPGSGEVSLNDISFFSFFAGPNGSSSISYNAYGRGENTGLNRIYDTSIVSPHTNVGVADFANVVYFYDNSTYQVTLNVVNTKTNPPPAPPAPPVDNAVNVNVELWGNAFSYRYLAGGGMAMALGTYGPTAVSIPSDDPIIFRGYWKVTVSGTPLFAGGTCNIDINGTSKVSGGSIPSGAGGATFDSATYGTEDVASYGGYEGLYFDVTVN